LEDQHIDTFHSRGGGDITVREGGQDMV